MNNVTIKIKKNLFVPWILEEFTANQWTDFLDSDEPDKDTIGEFVLEHAGLIPINHIANFKEIEPFIDDENKDWYDDTKTEYDYIYGTQDFNVQWV